MSEIVILESVRLVINADPVALMVSTVSGKQIAPILQAVVSRTVRLTRTHNDSTFVLKKAQGTSYGVIMNML
jgi:hypothetical protein